MSLSRPITCRWLVGFVLMLTGPAASAGQVWTVSLDTSKMAANYTGPFGLDFELIGSNGNTVTVGNFSFGSGGSAGPGPPFLTGGASGALGSSVSLSDSTSFFSDFNQQFTPGSVLSFKVDSTLGAPPSGGTPDNFSMVIFSAYDPVNGYNPLTGTGGTPIPTTDPSGSSTFFNLDVSGPGSTIPSSYPSSGGDITITVTPVNVIPEPSTSMLMSLGILGLLTAVCRRHAA